MEHFEGAGFKLGEGEPFFAEVFERRADVVDDGFVDNEETVVRISEGFYSDRRVLLVVLFEIKGELLGQLFGIDRSGYVLFTFGKEGEYGVVDVVIDQNDAFLGLANKAGNKAVRIVDLTVVKDAFAGRFGGLEGVKNTVEVFFSFDLKGELPLFHRIEACEDAGIVLQEVPHLDESIDDLNADFDGGVTAQDSR